MQRKCKSHHTTEFVFTRKSPACFLWHLTCISKGFITSLRTLLHDFYITSSTARTRRGTEPVETRSSYRLAYFISRRWVFPQYLLSFHEDCVYLCVGSVYSLTQGQGCKSKLSWASWHYNQWLVTKTLLVQTLDRLFWALFSTRPYPWTLSLAYCPRFSKNPAKWKCI